MVGRVGRPTGVVVSLAIVALVWAGATGGAVASRATDKRIIRPLLVFHGVVRPQPYQRWAEQMFVPGPPGEIDLDFRCEQFAAGCMDWTRPYATIGLSDPKGERATLAHELGHVFDYYVLAQLSWRDRFAAIDGRPWTTPASEERFAQTYALCAFNRRIRMTVSSEAYGWRLTPTQFSAACELIRAAYAAWLAGEPYLPR